jgi:hypothetical protein
MSNFSNAAKDGIEASKNVAVLVREVLLIVVIVLAISSPARVAKIMTSLGVTEWNVFGVKGNFTQASQASDTVHQLQDTITQLTSQVGALQSKTSLSPTAQKDVQQIAQTLDSAKVNVDAAQQQIQNDVVRQQQKLVAAGFVAPNEGWLYVGRVSEDKTTWVDGPKNVRGLPPNPTPPISVTTTNAIALRDPNSAPGKRAAGEIVAGVEANVTLQVLDTDFSHAKGGGNFLWLKVKTK